MIGESLTYIVYLFIIGGDYYSTIHGLHKSTDVADADADDHNDSMIGCEFN